MKRIGGFRRKSRGKLKIPLKEKGKFYISRFLQTFEEGTKVLLKNFSSFHKGIFDLRFYGRVGKIIGKQGICYKVSIKDGNKEKTLIVHPIHLSSI